MERAFLRVHFPYVEHLEIEAFDFHNMWNELVFAHSDKLRFEHYVICKKYQPMEGDLFQYVEQRYYGIWEGNTPYEFGFIQYEEEPYLFENELDPNIPIE